MIGPLALSVIFTSSLLLATCQSRFDVDELNYNFYDVAISDIPALLNSGGSSENGETPTSHETTSEITRLPETFENFTDRFLIGNKQGRLYLCGLPDKINNRELNDREIEHRRDVLQNLTEIDVTDTLNSYMKRCLKKTFGWWTYEFCFNDIIYQYHIENDRIIDEKLVLGRHDRTHVWNKSEQNTTFVYKKQPVFYGQNYTHGSLCDLSSRLRQTEVKFHCDDDLFSADLRRVDEPETCRYVLHVYVAGLCKFEAFQPVDKKIESQGLQCVPTLTPAEMERYEKYKAKAASQSNASKTTMTSSTTNEIEEAFPKLSLQQGLPVWDVKHVTFDGGNVAAANRDEDGRVNDVHNNLGLAEFFVHEIVNEVLDKAKSSKTLPAEDVERDNERSRDVNSEKTSESTSDVDEFNETPPKDNVDDQQIDTNTNDGLTEKNVVVDIRVNSDASDPEKSTEDSEGEEKVEGKSETTKNEAVLRTLAATLKRLIAEMEKTEKKLVETNKKLDIKTSRVKSMLQKYGGQGKKYSTKFSTNQNEAEEEATQDHVTTSRKSNPFEGFRRQQHVKNDKTPPPSLSKNNKFLEEKGENRRFFAQKSANTIEEQETDQSESTDTDTDQSDTTDLSTNRQTDLQDLEDDVKEQTKKLQNKILSTLEEDKTPRKVRVEIATAYYDEERSEMRVLSTGSGGDTKHVTNLLSYLLGNGEQQKEEKRHAKLELNYQFDFDDRDDVIAGQDDVIDNIHNDVIDKQNDVIDKQNDVIDKQNDVIAGGVENDVIAKLTNVADEENDIIAGKPNDVIAEKNDVIAGQRNDVMDKENDATSDKEKDEQKPPHSRRIGEL